MSYIVKVLTTKFGCAVIVDAGDDYLSTINPSTITQDSPSVKRIVSLRGGQAGAPLSIQAADRCTFSCDNVTTDVGFEFTELKTMLIEQSESGNGMIVHLFGALRSGGLHHLRVPLRYRAKVPSNDVITCKRIDGIIVDRDRGICHIDTHGGNGIKLQPFGWELHPVYGDQLHTVAR